MPLEDTAGTKAEIVKEYNSVRRHFESVSSSWEKLAMNRGRRSAERMHDARQAARMSSPGMVGIPAGPFPPRHLERLAKLPNAETAIRDVLASIASDKHLPAIVREIAENKPEFVRDVLANVLGAVPETARVVRAFFFGNGSNTRAVNGFLNGPRGLIPEHAARLFGVQRQLFARRAFEVLHDLPSDLQSRAVIEEILGPVFANELQMGDGSILITFRPLKDGDPPLSYLIGIGEQKKRLRISDVVDRQLPGNEVRLEAVNSITFRAQDGRPSTRIISRRIPTAGGGTHEMTRAPLVVVSAARLPGDDLVAKLAAANRPGRETIIDLLPLTSDEVELATLTIVRTAVLAVVQRLPNWGRP